MGKIHDDSSIVTGVLVVSEDFVSSNENALRTFLDEYKASSKMQQPTLKKPLHCLRNTILSKLP